MNKFNSPLLYSVLVAVSFLACGCGDSSTGAADSAEQKIAIVSYAEVAKETGLSEQLQKMVTQQVNQDNQSLKQALAKMNGEFEAKRQEYGDKPTDEQLKELKQLQNFIALQKNQGEQRIKQNQYMLQQRMGASLREQVRPIAMEIAKEQGYSIVLEHNATVLAFSEKINISQEVIIRLNEQNLGSDSGTKPGLDLPAGKDGNATPAIEGGAPNLDILTNPAGGGSKKKSEGTPEPKKESKESSESVKDDKPVEKVKEKKEPETDQADGKASADESAKDENTTTEDKDKASEKTED